MANRPIPSYALPSSIAIAQQIVDSETVLGVFAACEWNELHDDGKLWISAIVEEARRRFAAVDPKAEQSVGNVRPAPFSLTPATVAHVLDGEGAGPRVVAVPVAPVTLVDQPRKSDDPINSQNAEIPNPPTIPDDGGEEPERVASLKANPSAPAGANEPRQAGHPDLVFEEAFTTAKVLSLTKPERRSDVLYRTAKDRDARELESPVDRIAMIRDVAQSLARREATSRVARPSLGERTVRQPRPLPPLRAEERRRQLETAIAFLQRRGLLVSVVDRHALVRQYRVSGRRENKLADEVVAIARDLGCEFK